MDGMRNGSNATWSACEQKQFLTHRLPADETTMHFDLPSIQWEQKGTSENLRSGKAELHHRSCCCCQSGLKALAQMRQTSPLGATNFIKVHNIQKLLLLWFYYFCFTDDYKPGG